MHRCLRPALAVLIVMLALAPNIGAAAVYKWLDNNGVTHYGSEPPVGVDSQKLHAAPPPASGAAQQYQNLKSREGALERRLTEQKKAARAEQKQDALQKTQAGNCAKAKDQLHMLQTRRRIQVSEGGSVHTMTGEVRAQKIGELNKYMAKNCSGN